MFTPRTLNTIGLILGMLGVYMIFRWGPPQPILEAGSPLELELGTRLKDGRTVAERDRETLRLRAKHNKYSKAGLALVCVGFAFQLWAAWATE